MTEIAVSLTGANADTIVFGTDSTEADYILGAEVSGLTLPPLAIRFDEGITDGGRYVSTRRSFRNIDLPIYTLGTDRADVEYKLRRLGKLLSDRAGATRLTLSYSDDTEWYIDGYYTDGFNITYGRDGNRTYAKVVIQLRCPEPYFKNAAATTATYTTLGTKTVVNDGDVPTYPVWTLTGPLANVSFTANGKSWTYAGTLASGESVIVDTKEKTVKTPAGVNKYAELGLTPNLFPLESGTNSVVLGGGTFSGSIEIDFKEQREVIY